MQGEVRPEEAETGGGWEGGRKPERVGALGRAGWEGCGTVAGGQRGHQGR